MRSLWGDGYLLRRHSGVRRAQIDAYGLSHAAFVSVRLLSGVPGRVYHGRDPGVNLAPGLTRGQAQRS